MIRIGKGDYLVYERASRDEDRLFVETAKEIVDGIEEPKNWKRHDPRKHPGGRNMTYGFRQMLLVLLLMVYHRKEYREMEAYLKNNPHTLKELGLKKSPGKSTMQRATARIGISTLVKVNDAIVAKFKKSAVLAGRRT